MVDFEFEPLVVSIADAAEMLASSRAEVYQRLARGELQGIKDRSRTKVLRPP
jgi:hypothetical protein